MSLAIGVDVGGTKVAAGVVDPAGKIIERIAPFLGVQRRVETSPFTPAEAVTGAAAEEH